MPLIKILVDLGGEVQASQTGLIYLFIYLKDGGFPPSIVRSTSPARPPSPPFDFRGSTLAAFSPGERRQPARPWLATTLGVGISSRDAALGLPV